MTLEEAIEAVRIAAPPARIESVGAEEALGRILARDLSARTDHPALDVSAMDGYACRIVDSQGASKEQPRRLSVIGESAAGEPFRGRLESGQAVAISTGAALPEGSDGIALIEEARREGSQLLLLRPATEKHVRRRGEDLKRGEVYLRTGTLLDPYRLALAAGLGHGQLDVVRRPRAAVVVTGPELVAPTTTPRQHQLFDSNGPLVAGLLRRYGAEVVSVQRVGDGERELQEAWHQSGADLIVTTGGASKGGRDAVRKVLEQQGRLSFGEVAVRPGGPAMLAHWQGRAVLALPGNPVAAALLGTVLLRAWCRRALGRPEPFPMESVLAATPFRANREKTCLWLARTESDDWGRRQVSLVEPQGSARLAAFVAADALVWIPPGEEVGAGAVVRSIPLGLDALGDA